MGNGATTEKTGFYAPSESSASLHHDHNQFPRVITFSPKVSEEDEQLATAIMTAPTPDITPPMDTPDTPKHQYGATVIYNVNEMLTEIATEIDGDIPNHNYNSPTSVMSASVDEISSVNSVTSTVITHYDEKQQESQYAHIKLDFVKPKNYVSKISSVFTYHKQLGCGASCRVLLVHHNKNRNKLYALKEMQISDDLNRLLFAAEYKILNILAGHRNILSYHSSYIDKHCYYLSTTYCSGGTMLDRIIKQGHFNEKQCSEFLKDVLTGIKYMHDNHIVHRDIKCENLIFDKPGKDGVVKIIDFGNSEIINNPKEIDKLLIGSLHYLPPEMLSGKIRFKEELYKGDMWAIGVVCYVLVSGKVPFFGKDQASTLENIKRGTFTWPKNVDLSASCRGFISSLLNINIKSRMSATEALHHPWIAQNGKATITYFGNSYLNQIQLFSTANKLQKILINAILSEMDKEEKKILLTAIKNLDINGSGIINENDIINYILVHGNINEKQSNAKTKAKRFMTHVKSLTSYGVHTPKSKNGKGAKPRKSEVMHISLCEIDIEGMLDEIDEEEEKESFRSTLKPYTNSNKSTTASISGNNGDEELPTNQPGMQTKMSVERFSDIMHRADEDFDVSELVKKLHPTNSGHIPLQHIKMFNGSVHLRQSTEDLEHDILTAGLHSVDDEDDNIHEKFVMVNNYNK